MSIPAHQRKENPPVFYVCDRKACKTCNPDCKHTSNIEHAKNFTIADAYGATVRIERIEEIPTLPASDAAQPVIIGVDLAKGADHTAPDLMDKTREQFKAYGDDVKAVIAASDEAQAFGFRACPRNIYADDIAKSVCVCGGGKPCRKRFATCWKLYFKAKGGGK